MRHIPNTIPAFAGMGRGTGMGMRFRLSPEWCILIKRLKSSAIPAKAGISLRESAKKSHSCEGRNLRRRKAAGNCTPFTICAFGAEIPAFAGMGMRFRLSPEWRHFLSLRTIPNLAVSENIKNHHSGESRNLFFDFSPDGI
ncbi:MAG: hypothetical protein ACR2QC_09505 [Gammaproteobacteria bacterium]